MIDFILGLALAAMLLRGWTRGFVRETLDLVGLILGIWIAFRLSNPFGDFLTSAFDVSPELARIGGGIVLFVLFGALLSIAAHYLSKAMNLPGLSMVNRVGGAAVAMGWGVVIVLIVVSLASVLPLPDSWQDEVDESNIVQLIAGEDALPRRFFESVAGDNVMAAMAAIRDVFGADRAVPQGDEVLEFPAAEPDEVRQVRSEAGSVLEQINEDRVAADLDAVVAVAPLTGLAEERAAALYQAGILQRMENCAELLAERDYRVARCANGTALAGTAIAAYDAIRGTADGSAMLVDPNFDRAGVAVVDGPTGRLVVIVLAG
ncbi:MAG TPA: CvpA family protein [Acidimicrobiia bacterium]|nr:CvpA family protein [Acidimicrobiia bacterium]